MIGGKRSLKDRRRRGEIEIVIDRRREGERER